jgi:outer membrane protein assembly factor BamE
MNMFRISLLCCLAALAASCSMHVIDVQQGTIITPEMTEQLKPGMTRSQVRFVMGTPTLSDPFHHDRWDYIYTLKAHRTALERRHIALYFDGDTLVRIDDSEEGERSD